jgi:hypothetical protein
MDIKKILLKGPITASSIATDAGVTVSNVVQQLQKMEYRGEVRYTLEKRDGPGKPAKLYSLVNQVTIQGVIDGLQIDTRIDEPTVWETVFLNILRIPQNEYREYIMKWLFTLDTLPSNDTPCVKDIAELYVFGSVARGRADQDSDIDVLVVIEKKWLVDFLNEPHIIDGMNGYVTITPLCFTLEEFNANKDKDGNLKDILKEALLIWKKKDD